MKKIQEYKYFLLGTIVIFLISLFFPYSGDDWQWGTWDFSIEIIESLFTNPGINGRYVANIIVLILTKNIFVRGVVVAVVLNAIVEIISRHFNVGRLIPWVFIGLMSVEMFSSTISWVSGFTNYVISTLLWIFNIFVAKKYFDEKSKWYIPILLFLLFFISSFFIENITIFFLLFNLIVGVIHYLNKKKMNINIITSFLGSLIGTVCMFLQPCYSNVASGSDPYRTLFGSIGSIIKRALINVGGDFMDFIVVKNVFLMAFIVISLHIFYKEQKSDNRFIKYSFYYFLTFIIYIFGVNYIPILKTDMLAIELLNAGLALVFIIFLVIDLFLLFRKHKDFGKIMFILMSIVGLVLPITIVSPIGARNFFIVYILQICLALIIYKNCKKAFLSKKFLIVLSIVLLGYYGYIYGSNQFYSIARIEYIEEKYEKDNTITSVEVPTLPYPDYVWAAQVSYDDYYSYFFKTYHKIEGNIELEVYDYEVWYNEYYKESRKND